MSGVSARGRELVIRLRQPAPDLPWLAAESTCAVPEATPIVEGGLEKPVPSAGPYYLAALTDTVAVLKRNPNYGGSRPQHLNAIVVELNVPPAEAATRIQSGTLDYFLESQNPTLRPSTQAARAAGSRYRLTPYLGVHYFTFGYHRRLFADLRMRRALQYALDRQALAEADAAGGLPATRVLARGVHGYDATPLYPHRPDLRAARKLAAGRAGTAVVYTWVDPGYTDDFNNELRRQLAAVGIGTKFVAIDQARGFEPAKGSRADLVWGGLSVNSADPGAYLQQLSYLPPRYSNEIRRITLLQSPARERAAAALVQAVERDSLLAVYQHGAIPELAARRLGCIVHQPEYAGVDLAALCLKSSGDLRKSDRGGCFAFGWTHLTCQTMMEIAANCVLCSSISPGLGSRFKVSQEAARRFEGRSAVRRRTSRLCRESAPHPRSQGYRCGAQDPPWLGGGAAVRVRKRAYKRPANGLLLWSDSVRSSLRASRLVPKTCPQREPCLVLGSNRGFEGHGAPPWLGGPE